MKLQFTVHNVKLCKFKIQKNKKYKLKKMKMKWNKSLLKLFLVKLKYFNLFSIKKKNKLTQIKINPNLIIKLKNRKRNYQ